MFQLLSHALIVYVLAALIVEGHIFDYPRSRIIGKTPWLRKGGYHLLECRFCVGFWVATALSLVTATWSLLLPAWGAAHLLRRIEQPTFLPPDGA